MSDCPKCGGWGIGDTLRTYERFPCPECGAGAALPYVVEKGPSRLVFKIEKWGAVLSVWRGAGACSIEMTRGEMLALALALTKAARAK